MTPSARAIVAFLCLILTSGSPISGQNNPFHLWVAANDKEGKPANGLAATDFKILEDGKERPSSCFEETHPQQQSQQKKKLVIAIDVFNTSKLDYVAIRDQLVDFISNLDPDHWSVMVVGITIGNPTVSVPYTSDFDQVTDELESTQANTKRDMDVADKKRQINEQIKQDSSPRGRAKAAQLAAAFATEEVQQVQLTLQGLSNLGKYVDPDGTGDHIAVLLISGGLNIRPGRQYLQLLQQVAGGTQLGQEMDQQLAGHDTRQEIKKHVGKLNRTNVTIYALNIRGSGIPDSGNLQEETPRYTLTDSAILGDLQEGLTEVSKETGGIAFRGAGDFSKSTSTLMQDEMNSYVLCFNIDRDKKEKYHNIDVQTPKAGIELRFKTGFLAEEL